MSRRPAAEAALFPGSPLLITESKADFNRIKNALIQEIKPSGTIELMYAVEMSHLIWEILRLRRCKTALINSEFCAALESLCRRLLAEPGTDPIEVDEEVAELIQGWFDDPEAKKRVREFLKEFQLDECAIEAEAMKRSATALDAFDRMLASIESRRNKALRCIAEYRGGLARQMQESGDRIIEGKVLALEDGANKKRSDAA